MRSALAIAKKELNVYFTTPIAYVVITVIAFIAALFFNGSLDIFRYYTTRFIQAQQVQMLEHLNLTDMVVSRVYSVVAVVFVFVLPALSMRLFAEEKRSGTFQLLMTAPVKPWHIMLGKYLAALAMILAILVVIMFFPIVLSFYGSGAQGGSAVEWQTVFTGLLGLFLLGAMAMAIGLFVSALTDSVIVAFLVTFLILLTSWVVTFIAATQEAGPVKELVAALSSTEHLSSFLQGQIALKDLVYYLSFVVLGLFLTDRAIEGHRWA